MNTAKTTKPLQSTHISNKDILDTTITLLYTTETTQL